MRLAHRFLFRPKNRHARWGLAQIFWWFSGLEDVLRVVLRVVLGSETWAGDGWSAILRYTHHCQRRSML
jgi:hypothetical protein